MGKEILANYTSMTHTEYTKVFVETSIFAEARAEHLTDDEFRRIQALLTINPGAGDLIPGCKGLRKIRWGLRGRGKRGGVRILYYWAVNKDQILFLDLFAKNENDDLTSRQYKDLVAYFKREYP